ncbi:hypothetical protein HW132_35665 [Brasilonema sp. CT11]|nr:hypothetical protein [Brasilonema sp. CT11]
MLVLLNHGKKLEALADDRLRFHNQSIIHECTLDATSCGDVDEFGLTSMQLLTKPFQHLKQKFIKVEDIVKPDGLTLLRTRLLKHPYILSTWQSKNWSEVLGSADVETCLKSLDPVLFFQAGKDSREVWNRDRVRSNWRPLVRVSC